MAPNDSLIPDEPVGRREFIGHTATLAASLSIACRSPLHRVAGADVVTLRNQMIAASWTTDGGVLRAREVVDRTSGSPLQRPEAVFALVLADGTRLDSTQMRIVGTPMLETLAPNVRSVRAAGRIGGRAVTVTLEDDAHRLRAVWRAELRDGSRYLRQEVTFRP